MNNLLAAMTNAEYIVYTILMVLALILVTVYCIFRIRRERIKTAEKLPDQAIMNLESMKKYISRILMSATRRTKLHLFRIDIRNYDALYKLLGEEQYAQLLKEYFSVLLKLHPWGVKLGMLKKDSIIVLIKNVDVTVSAVCELILQSLSIKYSPSGDLSVDIAVNVAAESYPDAGLTADALIKNLEITMIISRRKGENSYALYAPQLANAETEEFKFYQEIHDAIRANEFSLYYQPIVDTNNFEVYGAEALLRWVHSTKGLLPPSEFLYVMEQTGDINWVGQWCFENMVKQYMIWNANYEQKFRLSVNLSERQLLNASLVEDMRKTLRKYKVGAENFILEISDINLYSATSKVKDAIDGLKATGFKICLEGFGSTFTSPLVLESVPNNMVKIDKAFWSRLGESTMVDSIIAAVTEYAVDGKAVIALGVESKEEIELLRNHGINYMQGYIFSKPKDAKDFIGDVVFTPWSDELKGK